MNEEQEPRLVGSWRGMFFGLVLLATALGGAILARVLSPVQSPPRNPSTLSSQPRPIVQIVRQQPGLPDLADFVDRLCPSVAMIVPHGSTPSPGDTNAQGVPASAYSADGWLLTAAADLPPMPLDAVFGDGRRVNLSDLRTDAVSGLAILMADESETPLTFSDQAYPRVGQFGLALTTPAGSGCSAASAMIGSDFLADGGSGSAYVRLSPVPDNWVAGTPLIGADGRVIGVGTDGEQGALVPASIASIIVDELIRNNLSASTAFGFRTIDYSAPISSRLADLRSGAGVALVQKGSSAEKAGLQAGDIITSVDDQPISGASELSRRLDGPASKVRLTVQRRSDQLELTIRRSSA